MLMPFASTQGTDLVSTLALIWNLTRSRKLGIPLPFRGRYTVSVARSSQTNAISGVAKPSSRQLAMEHSMASPRRIDVHFHHIPPFYREAVYAAGRGPAIGRYPDWSAQIALEAMDAHGIE